MLKLIKNEYNKIFLKKTTYIIIAICMLFGLGLTALVSYTSDDDFYYYEEETNIKQELGYYKNSKYIYDKAYYAIYSIYDELGYESLSDVPNWIRDAGNEIIYNHYIYVIANDATDREAALQELGESLDGIDIEYQRILSEKMMNALKSQDYKAFFKLILEDADHMMVENPDYEYPEYEYYKYMLEKNINPETDEDTLQILGCYCSAKSDYDRLIEAQTAGNNVSQSELALAKQDYMLYKYVLDNDIDNYMMTTRYNGSSPYSENDFMNSITYSTLMAAMAGIFVIIIAAGIIANEYSNGTIKFLLINPVKRAKIFWSKYITCISLLLFALIAFFILHFLFSIILCGTNGLDGVYLSFTDDIVSEQNIIIYALKQYALSAVSLVTEVTLAFMISAFLRSSALAIAASVVIELVGGTISSFLVSFGHDWGRFLIFSNTDLAGIAAGNSMYPGQTLTFALVTIAVYMIVFLLTAYDGFKKKEI